MLKEIYSKTFDNIIFDLATECKSKKKTKENLEFLKQEIEKLEKAMKLAEKYI